MMPFKLMKSVIVAYLILNSALASALVAETIPYYGQEFYQDYEKQTSDDALILRLKTILRSYHVQRPGQPDLIVQACEKVGVCYSHSPVTYKAARKIIMGDLYISKTPQDSWQILDVYCSAVRDQVDVGGKLGPGIIPDNKIMNVEHTWPQSKFNRSIFKDMQKSDLHHLFPTDSVINSIRGNHPFGEVSQDLKSFNCGESRYGLGTSGPEAIFEPPQVHKGNVARALFYFAIRYDLKIEDQEEAVLRKWNQEDPVDDFERERNNKIFEIQKNRNPFVDFPELIDRISAI